VKNANSFINNIIKILEQCSDKKAFHICGTNYSYSTFYEKVNTISNALLETKNKQQKVIVATNNDIETYASIIAVWLSGNIYVPLNIDEKNERLKLIEDIIDADIVLSSIAINENSFKSSRVINTNSLTQFNKPLSIVNIKPNDISYILFTSGTTGVPKGVPISYQNLNAFVDSFLALDYSFTSEDNFLQMADLSFDMSIISFLIPLCLGSSITTISNTEIKYLATYRALLEEDITVLITAPSTLQLLKPYYSEIELNKLRYTFVGAEAFYESTAKQWQQCAPNSAIINLYGPSEGGILSSTYCYNKNNLSAHNGIISIGKTVKNIDLIIVDNDGNIITNNDEGEACIKGLQIFDSYLDNTLNERKFEAISVNGKVEKYFKTGDIVFRNNEGNLFYCGRKDKQVKIQGQRVELGEIEFIANKFQGRFQSVAISYNGDFNSKLITLFIDNKIDENELSSYLKKHLPAYMLPTKIIGLEALPLNKNQKVDSKILESLINPKKENSHQNIISNFYSFFEFLSTKNTCNVSSQKHYNSVINPNSSWPNFTYGLNLNTSAKQRLEDVIESIKSDNTPNYIIIDDEQVLEHEDLLSELNFMPLAEWACLEYEEESAPSLVYDTKLDIKEVKTTEELKQWVKVASTGFGKLDIALFQECFDNKEVAFYSGYYHGNMVATAMLFFNDNTAGIYHVVTLPEVRKKGFGSQMFSYCQQEALQEGAKKIIAQSTQEGLTAWKNTGMKQFGNFYLFCWNKG